jgi:hypothetical protein
MILMAITLVLEVLMKNHTCVWRNFYNTARATLLRYYKYFAKHACDFFITLEPYNFYTNYTFPRV